MNILTLNAGSSSIKYKLFRVDNTAPQSIVTGLIEGIGEKKSTWHHTFQEKTTVAQCFRSHEEAFDALGQKLHVEMGHIPIDAIGHRIVHGGCHYFKPTLINDDVLQAIIDLSSLAPIHNPINALGVQFARKHFPNANHVALFDSGFHHTLPPHAHTYALAKDIAEQYQIRRYGFHGINHQHVSREAARFLKKPIEQCHFISLHLGNGASACLVKNGHSVDTSMGMTPLSGLIMGTRCGDIDPAIPLYLQQQGMSLKDVDALLNKKSGLLGIANDNDMRHLLMRMEEQGDESATRAIDMYVYTIQKTIGAYLSQIPVLDALIFTGGVGENAASIRAKIIEPLAHLGLLIDHNTNHAPSESHCRHIARDMTPILVIRGDEEHFIAEEVTRLLKENNV